ncbi:TIGR01777 family oxidoreductase [Planomicrobium sp. YIM 101495]|uniref:TIGR01777 family oxidoreductase n=1 Tax=Planomicrobium sp. YIM 101495 TaxID=2665160 RepID=UPI0012B76108|nr:TIGR01777 family oxidoreductase [Planomicrobium sp. YIM 101495]MTD29755.1 TIGR01777 family protein [Planomicrobium sp. YIM 101495]
MRNKIVIAGGTGFIGEYLKEQFERSAYEVLIVSRRKGHVQWNDPIGLRDAVDGAEMLINLAGKSVNCRYTTENKREIYNSRTETTEKLGFAVQASARPPALWINASTATIYRHAEDRPMTESEGEIGTGFSVDVGKAWEDFFFGFQLPHTRKAALRISIVLGSRGGVMVPYQRLVKFGLGGKQGNGKQMFSWIHIDDLYRMILFLQEQNHLNGVFNCAAPQAVTNKQFMKELRNQMKRPIGMPATSWMLEVGAVMIGTETELLLKSRWVAPERMINAGFQFRYPKLSDALAEITKK